jgi:endo-1,4-beta-xylanase
MLSRRHLMAQAAATTGLASFSGLAGCSGGADASEPLKVLAARKGLTFGSEVLWRELRADPTYAALIARECAQVTPGNEFKWGAYEPSEGNFVSEPCESLLQWASQAGLPVGAHALIWYRSIPKWAERALAAGEKTCFAARIQGAVSAFRGRVAWWDVVNEAIEPADGREDGLRRSPFLETLGPGYIADAFFIANAADPDARLYYNDYGFEYALPDHDLRRAALIRLLTDLKTADAPIDGIGIQGHLFADAVIDTKAFRALLRQVAALGLKIKITELDVRDAGSGDSKAKARRAADQVRRYLDIVLDEVAVTDIITWGLSDRYSYWMGEYPDGSPLPFDTSFQPKPMHRAIAEAIDKAPARGG